jgi:hypothetical protein
MYSNELVHGDTYILSLICFARMDFSEALTSANLQWCFPTLIGSLYVGLSVKEQTGNLDTIAVVI